MKKIIFFLLSCICAVCAVVFCGKAIDRSNDPIVYGVEYKRVYPENYTGDKVAETIRFEENGTAIIAYKNTKIVCIYGMYETEKKKEIFTIGNEQSNSFSNHNASTIGREYEILDGGKTIQSRYGDFEFKAESNPQLINWILFGLFTAATIATATLTVLAVKRAKKD